MLKTELSSFTHAQNAPSRVEETSHKRHQKALTITTFLVIFCKDSFKTVMTVLLIPDYLNTVTAFN